MYTHVIILSISLNESVACPPKQQYAHTSNIQLGFSWRLNLADKAVMSSKEA